MVWALENSQMNSFHCLCDYFVQDRPSFCFTQIHMTHPVRGIARDGGTGGGITWCHSLRSKNRWRAPLKRSSPQNYWIVALNEFGDQFKWKKLGLHHKSVELWFHIIIRCHSNWCHPKLVSPAAPLPPLLATPLHPVTLAITGQSAVTVFVPSFLKVSIVSCHFA